MVDVLMSSSFCCELFQFPVGLQSQENVGDDWTNLGLCEPDEARHHWDDRFRQWRV